MFQTGILIIETLKPEYHMYKKINHLHLVQSEGKLLLQGNFRKLNANFSNFYERGITLSVAVWRNGIMCMTFVDSYYSTPKG